MKENKKQRSMSLRWDERVFLAMYQFGMNVFFPPASTRSFPYPFVQEKTTNHSVPSAGFPALFHRGAFQRAERPKGVKRCSGSMPSRSAKCFPLFHCIRELHPRIKPAKLYVSVSTLSGYETARVKLKGSLDGFVLFPSGSPFRRAPLCGQRATVHVCTGGNRHLVRVHG